MSSKQSVPSKDVSMNESSSEFSPNNRLESSSSEYAAQLTVMNFFPFRGPHA